MSGGEVKQTLPFLPLPKALIADTRPLSDGKPLRSTDKIIWCAIKWWDWGEENSWVPTYLTLAELCGISERQAKTSVARLEESGWLTVHRSKGLQNVWEPINGLPEGVQHPQVTKRELIRKAASRGRAISARVQSSPPPSAENSMGGRADSAPTVEKGEKVENPPTPRAPDQQQQPPATHTSGGDQEPETPTPTSVAELEARRTLKRVCDGMPDGLARLTRASPLGAGLIELATSAIGRGWTARQVSDEVGGDWDGVYDPAAILKKRLRRLGDPPKRGERFGPEEAEARLARLKAEEARAEVAEAELAQMRKKWRRSKPPPPPDPEPEAGQPHLEVVP